MPRTSVIFVHGFISNPKCWDPFITQLERDDDLFRQGYSFDRFLYPTDFLQWDPTKRIPTIKECANYFGGFLDREHKCDPQLMLVGHSMGGLVIQSYLAQQIRNECGQELARIRSVILFGTPNRGSTIIGSLRGIFSIFRSNPQDEDLRVLNEDIADTSAVMERSILGAKDVGRISCPIPFRVFWGLQDNIVPEVSARGSFVEASALPGGHSEIIQCDDSRDERFAALKDALLNPVGHPSIYEIDLFEVTLKISPASPEQAFVLPDVQNRLEIHTDNIALRVINITFSKQNRCRVQYEQSYRSDDGFVELLGLTEPNEASEEDQSEYYSVGKKFTYLFTPDREGTFSMKLRIYNGFAEGQRKWHNHMKSYARYKRIRFTLDLKDYRDAGYEMSPEPSLYFHVEKTLDHKLCAARIFGKPENPIASADPWLRTWELCDIKGGVVDLVWDVKKKTG